MMKPKTPLTWVPLALILGACAPTVANVLPVDVDAGKERLGPPDSYTWRVQIVDVPGSDIIPTDLNNAGDVVGIRMLDREADRDVFVLAAGQVYLQEDLRDDGSSPLRINDARQVVGNAPVPDSEHSGAYRWSVDQDVLDWIDTDHPSRAIDMNAHGQVLVFRASNMATNLWDGPGTPDIRLETDGGDGVDISPLSLADDGSVVGTLFRSAVPFAARWPTPTTVQLLPETQEGSQAIQVAPSGWPVLGTRHLPGSTNGSARAVVWTADRPDVAIPRVQEPRLGTLNDTGWMMFRRDGILYEGDLFPVEELADLSGLNDVVPIALNDAGVIAAAGRDADDHSVGVLLIPEL